MHGEATNGPDSPLGERMPSATERVVPVLAILLACLLSHLGLTPVGAATSPDAVRYLEVARNLRAGRGLVRRDLDANAIDGVIDQLDVALGTGPENHVVAHLGDGHAEPVAGDRGHAFALRHAADPLAADVAFEREITMDHRNEPNGCEAVRSLVRREDDDRAAGKGRTVGGK